MRRILLILPFLLSAAAPAADLCAQWAVDPSGLFFSTTRGDLMGRYPGLRGWVLTLEECTTPYDSDSTLSPYSVSHLYHFDPHGNIVSVESTESGFNPSHDTVAFVYDHRARLSATVLFSDGDTSTLARYFYNDATDCIRLVANAPGGAVRRVVYLYSPQGVCKTPYDNRGRALLQTCYRDGRPVSFIDYDPYSGDPRQLLTVVSSDAYGNPLLLADALQPDNPELQTHFDYDPYGNLLSKVSWDDTEVCVISLYDLTHNWLQCRQVDNGHPTQLVRRTIRYATDSADFRDVYRLHDPFWSENNPTGFFEMHYPNGDYYLGDLLQGQPHGTGDLTLADGTSFSGTFLHGRYHGTGVMKVPQQGLAPGAEATPEVWRQASALPAKEIHALWQHGHIDTSLVTIVYADSSVYTGAFHPEGDSCRYRGRTDLPGGGHYEGEYRLERYDGAGSLRMADGTLYQGTWLHGAPHGDFLIVMPNLDRHQARFDHGLRVGVSTIEFINGDLYRGETDQQGVPNGMGSYTTAAGKTRTGYYLDGRYKAKHAPRR